MSRWKSPQAAAKQAERAAKEAEKLRKEKLKSRLLLVGVILLMIAGVVADYLWIRAMARQRHKQHQHSQLGRNTNDVTRPMQQKPGK